ncbi:transglycosylase domain-containing protein [Stackebrandtia nassauensis]|uniref:Peptidoglycan glycosyltransferase n=1 Tax=Stackebrandtia nassauensis (strain DSM 44728 / CIP 108903 / NRRL B-16338 / NBRC 102104 / LLR-40K-21) TaxID=446470 RepID=D3PY14_STANL|nr:transglycosylase domain-containing protein [Stackebrandtia nassauensis]ADD45343.1 Peptidoglycan glycosyltransferase [Stackebrandtia nassauensis DSM 44728]
MGSDGNGTLGQARTILTERKSAVWGLVKFSVITGVVVALGLLPVVGMSGWAAKEGADNFDTLPSDFTLPEAPDASTLYASDGKTVLATFGDQYRIKVKSGQISQTMKDAIIAAEDTRFYEHNGIDSKSILRALAANFSSGKVSEGASTITMQYVRQVLAYSASTTEEAEKATETSPERKLREARYALAVEKQKSKDEILTEYLNTVYFGHGAYGVGAAAKVYFGTTAAKLTVNQAAMLAGMVQSPSEYDPISGDADAAKDRRDYVLKRMVATDTLTKAEAAKIKKKKLPLDPTPLKDDASGAEGKEYGFFADYFEQWWSKQEQFGSTEQDRLSLLSRGGYKIVSSLDVDLQQAAEDSIAAKLDKQSSFALGSTVVEPGTGQIKVMAVNRNYSSDDSSKANTTNPLLSGGSDFAGYQAGSTFKMFTMLAALDAGMDLSTSFYSPQRYTSQYYGGSGDSACGVHWCPSNASPSMTGNQTMWSGFGKSVNTYFVQLEEKVGADKAVEMAERLGLTWNTEVDQASAKNAADWGAFTLGVSSTTPLELAAAYATIANDGVYAAPTPVKSIRDASGANVSVETKTKRVLDTEVARAATDAARCPTGYGAAKGSCNGGATAPQVASTVGGPVAGKTGTTDGDSTAWFAGYTPNLAVASFAADPDDPTNLLPSGMTAMPINVSADVLGAGWRADPTGEFTPPSELVGQAGPSNDDNQQPNRDQDDTDRPGNSDDNGPGPGNGNGNGNGGSGDEDDGGLFGEDGIFGRQGRFDSP